MRNYTITRLPDKEQSFLHNNVRVHYVGTNPKTDTSFYCALHGGNYGVKVIPGVGVVPVNASVNGTPNCKYDAARKQRYLKFQHAFGHNKRIYVSHAVWMAAGRPIPEGMTMDHINGCTTDNRIENLRCIDLKTNMRDGGFLRKLRNKGIDPTDIQRNYLLRYYARMAKIKEALTAWQYHELNRDELYMVLYFSQKDLYFYFLNPFLYDVKIDFEL